MGVSGAIAVAMLGSLIEPATADRRNWAT